MEPSQRCGGSFLCAELCVQILFDGSAEIFVGVGEEGLINGGVGWVITGFELAFDMTAHAGCGGELQRVGKNSLAGLLIGCGLYFRLCGLLVFGRCLLLFCFGHIDGSGAVGDNA